MKVAMKDEWLNNGLYVEDLEPYCEPNHAIDNNRIG